MKGKNRKLSAGEQRNTHEKESQCSPAPGNKEKK